MARRNNGREVHGILLLDKREGVSSNKALQEVRRLLNAKKAGHSGSLDPLATGLLPLCFGEATKVSALMLDDDKRYQVEMRLGVMTDTGDAEGRVLQQLAVPDFDDEQLHACLQRFCGEIEQVPPMYSALKHNGRKLYELAREGKTVERKVRRVTIYKLVLISRTHDRLILDVHCSKGTYIRSLVEDLGFALGCCASVTMLRRTAAGCFSVENALSWEQLQNMDTADIEKLLLAVDTPLQNMPVVNVSGPEAEKVRHGQQLQHPCSEQGVVRMYCEQVFLGLGEMLLDGTLAPKKLFHLN